MANIIPMAGLGSRFANEGYNVPKPLIPVSGEPMIIRVVKNLPSSDKWIFIVRQEHVDMYGIDKVIKTEIPNAIIIPVSKTTEGQACTCMLAEPHLDPEEPILIAACDNGYLYDEEKYESLCADKDIDAVIWTFTRRDTLKDNPKAWGWCKLGSDGLTITDVSVKVPVSDDPFNDHAVVATFYFKKAKYFIDAVNLMIRENYRVNGEFYVDAVPLFLNKMAKRSVIFDVDLYVGFGTPRDLKEYERMEMLIKNNEGEGHKSDKEKETYKLWQEYFKKFK